MHNKYKNKMNDNSKTRFFSDNDEQYADLNKYYTNL